MNYYPEPVSQIRHKIKIDSELSNHVTKKELYHATGADTSDLAAKKGVIAF